MLNVTCGRNAGERCFRESTELPFTTNASEKHTCLNSVCMCNQVSFRLVAAMAEEVGSSYTHTHLRRPGKIQVVVESNDPVKVSGLTHHSGNLHRPFSLTRWTVRQSSRQRLRPQLGDLLFVHAACDTTSANFPFFLSSLHCLLSFVCGVPAGQRLIPKQRMITLSLLASLQLPLSSLTSRSDARTLRREQIWLVSNIIISPDQLGETCCSCNPRAQFSHRGYHGNKGFLATV